MTLSPIIFIKKKGHVKMKDIVLYSNHCVKCDILKEKLDNLGIDYDIEDNIDNLKNVGFTHMPMLKIKDKCMTFKEAFNYLSGGNG